MSTISYLDRFLDPMVDVFPPDVARAVVDLRAGAELQADIENLRNKARAGTLTADEELAYRELVEAIDVISIIQSKARRSLARTTA